MSPDNIDEEGWSYAVNFGEFRDLESGQFDDLNKQMIDDFVVVVDDDDDDVLLLLMMMMMMMMIASMMVMMMLASGKLFKGYLVRIALIPLCHYRRNLYTVYTSSII